MDARVVQQRAEAFAPVDKLHDAGSILPVMWLAIVAFAVLEPDLFKRIDDGVNLIRQKSGESQEAKRVEQRNLLLGERNRIHEIASESGEDAKYNELNVESYPL